jgi:hypothetical protein
MRASGKLGIAIVPDCPRRHSKLTHFGVRKRTVIHVIYLVYQWLMADFLPARGNFRKTKPGKQNTGRIAHADRASVKRRL